MIGVADGTAVRGRLFLPSTAVHGIFANVFMLAQKDFDKVLNATAKWCTFNQEYDRMTWAKIYVGAFTIDVGHDGRVPPNSTTGACRFLSRHKRRKSFFGF